MEYCFTAKNINWDVILVKPPELEIFPIEPKPIRRTASHISQTLQGEFQPDQAIPGQHSPALSEAPQQPGGPAAVGEGGAGGAGGGRGGVGGGGEEGIRGRLSSLRIMICFIWLIVFNKKKSTQ